MVSEPFITLKFKNVTRGNGLHKASLSHSFHLTRSRHQSILLHELSLRRGLPAWRSIFSDLSAVPSGSDCGDTEEGMGIFAPGELFPAFSPSLSRRFQGEEF